MFSMNSIWAILVIGFSFFMLFASMLFWFKRISRKWVENFLMTAMTIIKWAALGYIVATIFLMVVSEPHSFINRATGPYAWAYWMMMFGIIVLPQLYWIPRMRSAPWRWMIAIGLLFTSGAFFEEMVIIITSYHRDYNSNETSIMNDMVSGFILVQLKRIAVFSTVVVIVMDIKKRIYTTPNIKS